MANLAHRGENPLVVPVERSETLIQGLSIYLHSAIDFPEILTKHLGIPVDDHMLMFPKDVSQLFNCLLREIHRQNRRRRLARGKDEKQHAILRVLCESIPPG